jgi:hypothetical protein
MGGESKPRQPQGPIHVVETMPDFRYNSATIPFPFAPGRPEIE